jgi:hypothetical protein
MTRALSLRAGQRFFAQLSKAISRAFGRLAGTDNRYRPEKHYMRGPGPKSTRTAANKQ